jgi:hypothetical protein
MMMINHTIITVVQQAAGSEPRGNKQAIDE